MSVGTKASRSSWSETLIIVVEALAIAMFVRVFFYQPFNIPSGSMKETLLIGDYLFVSKLSYGYSKFSFPFSPNLFSGRIWGAEPKRGDVAVFKLPRDNSTDYIKRVMGLPGDEIQMKDGQVFINGVGVPKVPAGEFTTWEEGHERTIPVFEETLPNGVKYKVLDSDPNGPYDNTGVYKVPPDHYFMMGDNRDNSRDSRFLNAVGYVPEENLVGKARIIFFSDQQDFWKIWGWYQDVRWKRIFNVID